MILSNNNEYIINYSLRSLSYSGGGCDYNNKYEIPTYGSKSRDKIQIRVRHYQDSYIAAEEITKGCSSTNIYETNCISNTVSNISSIFMRVPDTYSVTSKYEYIIDDNTAYWGIGLFSDVVIAVYFIIRWCLPSSTSNKKVKETPKKPSQSVVVRHEPVNTPVATAVYIRREVVVINNQ